MSDTAAFSLVGTIFVGLRGLVVEIIPNILHDRHVDRYIQNPVFVRLKDCGAPPPPELVRVLHGMEIPWEMGIEWEDNGRKFWKTNGRDGNRNGICLTL